MALGNGVCAGGASGWQWPCATSSQCTPGDRRPTVAASASRQPAGLVPCGIPLSAADASEYGLAGVEGPPSEIGADALPKAVALAFAESTSLEPLVASGESINTKAVEKAFKAYLAEEIRRIAKKRGVSSESLCDVTDRALREWAATREGKK